MFVSITDGAWYWWRILHWVALACFVCAALLSLVYISRSIAAKRQARLFRKLYSKSPYRNPLPAIKRNDEFLMREQKAEKLVGNDKGVSGPEFARVKRIGSKDDGEREMPDGKDSGHIVGVAEPKGFWSRFIMGQKLSYIMARLGAPNKGGQGFWVNFIHAQDMGRGRGEGRGR